jgi:predicted transcriptional regulator
MTPLRDEVSQAERDDLLMQRAVLEFVLAERETILTFRDLAMEFDREEAAARAVRDLVAVGLLRREGGSVLPTRAAIHYDRLGA